MTEVPDDKPDDESYVKLTNLMKEELTREKVEKFMEENPGLIIYVPNEKAQIAQKKFMKFMKRNPIGKKMLKQEEIRLKMRKQIPKENSEKGE